MLAHILDYSVQEALLRDVECTLAPHQYARASKNVQPGKQYVAVDVRDAVIPREASRVLFRHTTAHQDHESHLEASMMQVGGGRHEQLAVNARFFDVATGVAFVKSLIALCDSTYSPEMGLFGLNMSIVPLVSNTPLWVDSPRPWTMIGDRDVYGSVMRIVAKEHLLLRPETERGRFGSSTGVWFYGRNDLPHSH